MSDPSLVEALAGALSAALGRAVTPEDLGPPRRLSAGAARRTYVVPSDVLGEVVLQVERPGASKGLPATAQAALVARAGAAGVPVPEIIASGTAPNGPLQGQWTVSAFVAGETIPRRLLRDLDGDARRRLLDDVAAAAARIHELEPGALPQVDALAPLAEMLAMTGRHEPVLALGLRWLTLHRPPARPTTAVHGDLRMGNLLVDDGRLTAVLDWELATAGDGHADLGWFCSRAWRFGEDAAAGGLGTRRELLDAYASSGGEPPDEDTLRWWELWACVRWGVMCLLMDGMARVTDPPVLEPLVIGRRVAEACWDTLRLLPGGAESATPRPGGAGVDEQPVAIPAPGRGDPRELLDTVATLLGRRADDPTAPRRWETRVATTALETASRQWALDASRAAVERETVASLGTRDVPTLCSRITDGDHDAALPDLATVLTPLARTALHIVAPTHL